MPSPIHAPPIVTKTSPPVNGTNEDSKKTRPVEAEQKVVYQVKKIETKKPNAKKPEPKKPDTKKPELKKTVPKKAETKQPETKKKPAPKKKAITPINRASPRLNSTVLGIMHTPTDVSKSDGPKEVPINGLLVKTNASAIALNSVPNISSNLSNTSTTSNGSIEQRLSEMISPIKAIAENTANQMGKFLLKFEKYFIEFDRYLMLLLMHFRWNVDRYPRPNGSQQCVKGTQHHM